MPNYQLGKVYKLVNDDDDQIYIGSTTQRYLCNRMTIHRNDHKLGRKMSACKILEKTNPRIVLIELWPCNSKDELTAREEHHRKLNAAVCVNKIRAKRTAAEKREQLNAAQRRYYAKKKAEAAEEVEE